MTSEIFAEIGGKATKVVSEVDGSTQWVTDNLVRIGVDAMKGSGQEVMNLAKALETMSKIANPQEIEAHQTRIKDMLVATMNAFAEIGAKTDLIERTKLGIDAVKGAGSELNSIIEAFMKFKTTKEEKLPDFNTVETDIKRMIKFSAELFSVLGGDTSITMEGVTPIDKDIVQAGITSAQQLTTGITELGKLNEAIQKLKGDSSEGIKTLTSQYKQMLDLINSTNIKPESLEQY